MGQYRQWLHHRELDRTLRAQLNELANELEQLSARAISSQPIQAQALLENTIVMALAMYQAETGIAATTTPTAEQEATFSESISSALQAWSNLSTDAVPLATAMDIPQTPVPHHDLTLLPDDMAMFLDEHSTTQPRIATPWWLRNILASSNTELGSGLINQHNIGTNRLIQRWVARWGQQIEPTVTQESPTPEDVERELQQ